MKTKILLVDPVFARLSKKAIELYLQKKKLTVSDNRELIRKLEKNGYDPLDPILIQVIEELGIKADSVSERPEKKFWGSPAFLVYEIDNERDFIILIDPVGDCEQIFYEDEINWLILKSSKKDKEVHLPRFRTVKCDREFAIFFTDHEDREQIFYKNELSWRKSTI